MLPDEKSGTPGGSGEIPAAKLNEPSGQIAIAATAARRRKAWNTDILSGPSKVAGSV
jgi:hypothetical protein